MQRYLHIRRTVALFDALLRGEKTNNIYFVKGWFDCGIHMDASETMKRLCAHRFDI